MHLIVANERKEKLVLKYVINNAKDIKALKPKVQNKHHDQKTKN
jgi:hypothetical protein